MKEFVFQQNFNYWLSPLWEANQGTLPDVAGSLYSSWLWDIDLDVRYNKTRKSASVYLISKFCGDSTLNHVSRKKKKNKF